ncbi:MAG: formate dehydrogenase accessory sulfurtransferase FdhD [Chloroflexi bacterium]|nr:formate dehydrogenase accessory sulfurtransferase FdhD [Chloroflexota bacterium]
MVIDSENLESLLDTGYIERVQIQRINPEGRQDMDDIVVREQPLTIVLNDQELVTLLSSPADMKYLAVGFLSSEGMLNDRSDIKRIAHDERRGIVWVETTNKTPLEPEVLHRRLITSGCGRGASFYSATDVQADMRVESSTTMAASKITDLVMEFQHRSEVYRATGGVHSAALSDGQRIVAFHEDIGRHNAVDKVFGDCILNDISTADGIIITSGRISSEILLKIAHHKIPVLISKSAPTNLGLNLANNLGITLIGFVRGKRMNVYTNAWRVTG